MLLEGDGMYRVRIRGIYATALTKIFLDENFEIVQPSVVIEERFDLPFSLKPYDVDIYDRTDKQGVSILCLPEIKPSIASILHGRLLDAIIRCWKPQVGGIYKGIVREVDKSRGICYVEIEPDVFGILKSSNVFVGDELIVQVDRERFRGRHALLSTDIKIVGNYAILIPKETIKISRKIRDPDKRLFLVKLGQELRPRGWGIIWRTAALSVSEEDLKSEILKLLDRCKLFISRASNVNGPAILMDGLVFLDVEFPSESKKILDTIRSEVTPTVPGHHYLKSFNTELSALVDMAESLLRKGSSREEVLSRLNQLLSINLPQEGDDIVIKHVKLNGKTINIGPARIEHFNQSDGTIVLRRNIVSPGVYDGLNVVKSPGDYAITRAKIGEWFLETRYFSCEGKFKGAYININTPIEIYSNFIRYVDLEVDVCVDYKDNVSVLDRDKLCEALKMNMVSKSLFERVDEIIKHILDERIPVILEAKN